MKKHDYSSKNAPQKLNPLVESKRMPISFYVIFLLLFLVSIMSFGQVAPVNPPIGGFDIDGNLLSDSEGDWIDDGDAATVGGFVLQYDGSEYVPINANNTKFSRDLYNTTSDNSFTGGSSFGDNPNTWSWTNSKATSKCDINTVILHQSTSGTEKWLMLAGDRLVTNGTSYIDFEFSQGVFTKNEGGTFTSVGADGTSSLASTNGRTIGDFVLSMEYSNGGGNANVHFYVWEASGSSYQFVEKEIPVVAMQPSAYGATNESGGVSVPYEAFGSNNYIAYAFVEAAINIDAIFNANCLSANIKTVFVKTKASDSYNAALKDFVDPIPVDFQFGNAQLDYDAAYCKSGTASPNAPVVPNGTFSSSQAGLVWSNPTAGNSQLSNDGIIDLAASSPGSYTITYTPTGNVCLNPAMDTVVINPLPTANAGIDQTLCQSGESGPTSFTLAGSGSNGSFKWTKVGATGTADVSGFDDDTSLTTNVSVSGIGSVTLQLTTTSGYTPSCGTPSDQVVLNVNPNPTVNAGNNQALCQTLPTGPTDFTLAGTGTNATFKWTKEGSTGTADVVSFSDDTSLTSNVSISGIGTVTLKLTGTSDQTPSCGTINSTVVLTVNSNPTVNAGSAQTLCQTQPSGPTDFTLAGTGTNATFKWTKEGSTGTADVVSFTDDTSLTSNVSISGTGTVTLKLTATSDQNPSCGSINSTVVLTVNPNPTVNAGSNQALCQTLPAGSTDFTLAGTGTNATFKWTKEGSTGTADVVSFTDDTSLTSNVSISGIGTVTLKLTATSDQSPSCGVINSTVVLIVNPNPTSNAGSPQALCQSKPGGPTVFNLNGAVVNGTPQWSQVSSTGTASASFTSPNSATGTVSVSGVGTVTLRLTCTSGFDPVCSSATNDVILTVNPNPGDLTGNVTQPTCGLTTGTIAVTSTITGLTFSIDSENPEDFTNNTGVFSGLAPGSYVIRAMTINGCISNGMSKIIYAAPNVPSTPVVQVSDPATCSSAQMTLQVVSPVGSEYQYINELEVGGVWQSSVYFNINAGDGFSIKARRTDDTTCISDAATCEEPEEEAVKLAEIPKIEEIKEVVGKPAIKAYPNPFNNEVNFKVDVPDKSEGELVLMNLLGQRVMTVFSGEIKEGSNHYHVNLPSLNSNTLIYILSINGERFTGKLVQNKM
ncbi:T9SS type A sorting domain-containing protein [Mangrovimonas futianensis]|uniref:T9SS type A sorting domain-containing protein n=2 Tax=Mangrovimonas futianensis TaxID=2895523 RepID=UPI001E432205|nr:T9SS type A sorting domain-containing protein [Mangrovimonas futianensis]MCF1194412.1 T9SS type A sorting domain-containing protein [Mangrovimonas futianensis]